MIKMRSFRDSPHRVCVAFLHIYNQLICCQKCLKTGPIFIRPFCMFNTLLVYQSSYSMSDASYKSCVSGSKCRPWSAYLFISLQLSTDLIAAPDYRSDCNFLQIRLRHQITDLIATFYKSDCGTPLYRLFATQTPPTAIAAITTTATTGTGIKLIVC